MLADWACTSAISGSATNTVAAGRGRTDDPALAHFQGELALGREALGLLAGGRAREHAYEQAGQHGRQMRQPARHEGTASDAK